MIGRTLSHYKVLEEIGRGGMGIVYKAVDLKLNREVALKVLPPELVADRERKRRFIQEAQAAGALEHPNIGVIHEIDEVDDVAFIVMELIDGEKLSDILMRERLPVARICQLVSEIAEGLACAHDKGIIHRDLKPANVMVTHDGRAKIIDFGLAKLAEPISDARSAVETAIREKTRSHAVMGTVSYMSPEQALGQPVDARSDLFSLGVALYEMATGSKPFDGDTTAAVFEAILHETPTSPRQLNEELPPPLEQIIGKLLKKDPGARFQSSYELVEALRRVELDMREPSGTATLARRLREPRWAIAVVALVAVTSLFVVCTIQHGARVRWAREQAIPEITRLIEDEAFVTAFELASEAEAYIPDDPTLAKLWPELSRRVSVETVPEGADVYLQAYGATENEWEYLGKSPLDDARIPRGFFRWKMTREGYESTMGAGFAWFQNTDVSMSRTLDKEDEAPFQMVRVDAGSYAPDFLGLRHLERVELDTYWVDRYEVTNEQYKAFYDAGAYREKKYWKHELIKDGRALTWDEAMTELVDAAGRPGPSTWELGDYPEGQDDYPVTGVSWYEAAAYAEFAGKQLPSLYHWGKAAGTWLSAYVAPLSNFDDVGVAPVGRYRGTSPVGAYDMAGNVKEWCWNESGTKRFIVGGGWNEPAYMFLSPDAQEPFRRLPNYGFRCMKRQSADEIPAAARGPITVATRDLLGLEPISDEVFEIYRRLFSYDETALNPAVEWRDDSAEDWSLEIVSFDAAYGGERISAYVYLPKNFSPPYQTVVYFPGADAISRRSSEDLRSGPSGGRQFPGESGGLGGIDFLLRSGRAILYPVYKSTYERGDEIKSNYPDRSTSYRDHVIMWSKDLGRSIDYLESRPEFNDKLAFYGFSWGAQMGAILPAFEDRLRTVVLVGGGFKHQESLPEADQATFAPRVKTPALMLNGRHDWIFPVQRSQVPMFELLGTPEEDKRHVVFDSGHSVPRREGIREILDWLDKYLGPVSSIN